MSVASIRLTLMRGRLDAAIGLIVVHNISLPPGRYGGGYISQLFTNTLDASADSYFAQMAGLHVSAHVLIERDGAVTQFVSFADRAWHAGASCFDGRTACNDFSIGIELEGTDFEAFSDAQYDALNRITAALLAAYPINCHARPLRHCAWSENGSRSVF